MGWRSRDLDRLPTFVVHYELTIDLSSFSNWIANLTECRSLEVLDLTGTKNSDSAVATLCIFKSLRCVNLSSTNLTTKITLKGLEAFIGNPSVTYLWMNLNRFPYLKGYAVLQKIRAIQPKGKQILSLF